MCVVHAAISVCIDMRSWPMHTVVSLEEGMLAEDNSLRLRLTLSLTGGRRWDKRHRQRNTAGSWLCWLKYVIRTSMNAWIISSILTNRASDRYSEHSKREYHETHKDSCDWHDWEFVFQKRLDQERWLMHSVCQLEPPRQHNPAVRPTLSCSIYHLCPLACIAYTSVLVNLWDPNHVFWYLSEYCWVD